MNEMILNHYYFHGDPVGFKVKFSSDKPESKQTISFESFICIYQHL